MTIQITRWSPDTCGCVLEYEWDDSVPQDDRIHTFKRLIRRDGIHGNIANDSAVYTTVVRENTMKNQVFGLAQKVLDTLLPADYVWYFDSNRVLHAGFHGKLSASQTSQLQSSCDGAFGTGKVVVRG